MNEDEGSKGFLHPCTNAEIADPVSWCPSTCSPLARSSHFYNLISHHAFTALEIHKEYLFKMTIPQTQLSKILINQLGCSSVIGISANSSGVSEVRGLLRTL